LTDANGGYLPLSGGTMTGNYIGRSDRSQRIGLLAGTDLTNGGYLVINGDQCSGDTGAFFIKAQNNLVSPQQKAELEGYPNGTLKWNGANVLTDANGGYLPLSGGTLNGNLTIGADKFISGADRTRQLVLWGGPGNYTGGSLILYGNTRGDAYDGCVQLRTLYGNDDKSLICYPNGNMTWGNNDLGGSAIVAKSLGTTGYYKRADGLIEQWGQTTAPATAIANMPVTFPITFPNEVCSVVITSEGNLTAGNSAVSYTQVIDVTNSGFKYRSFSNSPEEIKKYWRAIGY
jgi:hypothetical protein